MSSLDGESVTKPGLAFAEARRVDTSTLRWTHQMQDGEELDGSLLEEEFPTCRPGREQTSSSLEADDSVRETDMDRGPSAESVTAESEELSSSSDELHKEFLSVLGTVEACEGGDPSSRGKPFCKGILVSQQLLKAVDNLIVEKYEKGEHSL